MQKVVSQATIEPTPRDSAHASVDFSLTPSPAQTVVTAHTGSPLRKHTTAATVNHQTVEIDDFRDQMFMPRATVPATRESIEFTQSTKPQRKSPSKVSNGPPHGSSYHETMASSSNHICFSTNLPVDSRNFTSHYQQKGLSPQKQTGKHITVGDLLDQPEGFSETMQSHSSGGGGIQTYQKRTKQQQNYSFKKAK